MKLAVLTDIHANMRALEAVMNDPDVRRCGGIVSAGDHLNYGPMPRETHAYLAKAGAVMLMGNHEDRLNKLRAGGDFSAVNWSILRWTKEQTEGLPLELPLLMRCGHTLITHASPYDPYYHMEDIDVFTSFTRTLPDDVHTYIYGHDHSRRDVHIGHIHAVNPGALGMFEGDRGGVAPFVLVDTDTGTVTRRAVRYDVDACAKDFLRSGLADAAPVMARITLDIMREGRMFLFHTFLRHRDRTEKLLGFPGNSTESWYAADRTFAWRENCDSRTFWKRLRAEMK